MNTMEIQQEEGINRPKLNIGFFFLSLGFLVTLITSVVSFLNLAFSTLDKKFPDVLNSNYAYGYSSYDYESIRVALATLIIFFPVFLIVAYFWNKKIEQGIGHTDALIRKWLIYIVLFLSSLVVAIDLVTLVRYFVSGEITNRFLYKVIVALVVAVFVGGYFIFQLLEKKKVWKMNVGVYAALKSVLLVALIIIFSFSVTGSPKSQRLLRLDDRRVQDLQSIQYQVINYWQQKEKLPENLPALSNPLTGYSLPVDPEFEKGYVYEYKTTDKMTFELCATFALPMPKGWSEYSRGGIMPVYEKSADVTVAYPSVGGMNESWDHESGRTCFSRTIDKDIYPPYPKPESR